MQMWNSGMQGMEAKTVDRKQALNVTVRFLAMQKGKCSQLSHSHYQKDGFQFLY